MQLTRSEHLLAQAGIVATIGFLFALLGLFTPPGMALGLRMAFWIIGLLAAWVAVGLLAQVGTAVAKLIGLRPMWGYAITIPLSSVAISVTVLWWLGGVQLALGDSFVAIWPSTLLIGVGFFGLFYLLYARAENARDGVDADAPAGEQATEPGVAASALHDRLAAGFPHVLALSVEDHYTRAHAEHRSEMLLMPLGEAIALMPEDAGTRVHRSWWVARSAVRGHRRDGRDIRLILHNGMEVPVSRANVQPLRDAGWLG